MLRPGRRSLVEVGRAPRPACRGGCGEVSVDIVAAGRGAQDRLAACTKDAPSAPVSRADLSESVCTWFEEAIVLCVE